MARSLGKSAPKREGDCVESRNWLNIFDDDLFQLHNFVQEHVQKINWLDILILFFNMNKSLHKTLFSRQALNLLTTQLYWVKMDS